MATKHSSIVLASEGSFDTTSTDSLSEMRSLVQAYAEDPNGAVLDGWEPREGTIITEVRAISARINQNFDAWPSEELREAHHTFIGKPVFVNHMNHDPDRARGRVVASRYVDAGEEDRYVQVLQEVEASRFPMLAKELMEGGLDSVSMGAEAREVECSYCSNISTSPFDACEHIPLKGSYLQRRTASGTPEDILVYEICRKISFFELSYVFDPADETAVASNVLVANRREAVSEVEVPPKVDTLHPDEDEKSQDDWQEFVDDPNVIDTIDVLDEPDLGLNQELERVDDELPEGFEEFADVDDRIEENEQAEKELAQDAREKSQEKADAEAEKAQQQFEQAEPDPEDDDNWEDEDDGAGGTSSRFKGGGIEALVADDYGTFNMWVEKNGSLIASDSYSNFSEAKAAAVEVAKKYRKHADTKESKMSRIARRGKPSLGTRKTAQAFTEWMSQNYPGKELLDFKRPEQSKILNEYIQEVGEGNEVWSSRRKQASALEGWDTSFNNSSATFQDRDFQLWVATDDYDDGTENWQLGEWSVYDSTFSEVASGHENSVNSAVWAAINAAEGEGFDTGSVPASGNTNASRRARRKQAELWEELDSVDYETVVRTMGDADTAEDYWQDIRSVAPDLVSAIRDLKSDMEQLGVSLKVDEYWNLASRRKTAQWEHAHPEEVGDPSAVAAWKYENPDFPGDAAVREYDDGTFDYIVVGWDDDILMDGSARSLEEAQSKVEDFFPSGVYGFRGSPRHKQADGWDWSAGGGKKADDDFAEFLEKEKGFDPYSDDPIPQGKLDRAIDEFIRTRGDAYSKSNYDSLKNSYGYGEKFSSLRRNGGNRKTADIASDDQAFKDYLSELTYPPSTPEELDVAFYDDFLVTERPNLSQHSVDYIGDMIVDSPEDYYISHTPTYSSRRNGKPRVSRTKNRDTSRRSNRMAPQRRRRIGDNNKQTPLLEETGIARTPAPEPVALPEEGDSVSNNSESDRVKSARRALAREMARDRAAKRRRGRTASFADMSDFDLIEMHGELENELMDGSDDESRVIRDMNGIQDEADKRGLDLYDPNFDPNERAFMSRRRRAKAVGQNLSGASVKREDLFENYSATTMTAKLRKRFAAWVRANYGASLRQASGPGELRSWARAFAKEAGIEPARLHAAIKRDVVALRTAEDKDDIPDFIEEKIEDDEDTDSKKESARRRAAARRAAMQARRGRGRTKTTRRRTADEKLDLAAPGDRVNVEKPTSGTTDADAEASQFDKADFDNNSGKGLENPDTTPVAGTPGGPSVNDLKKTSRATGLQAVRLAEAMIAAGLLEDSTESKFKAAAQFEKMSRDIVLDRTALLEKVATVHAKRRSSATKSAGNRGTSLNSAVPPNMTGMTRSSAPQTREASSANDSDLFF